MKTSASSPTTSNDRLCPRCGKALGDPNRLADRVGRSETDGQTLICHDCRLDEGQDSYWGRPYLAQSQWARPELGGTPVVVCSRPLIPLSKRDALGLSMDATGWQCVECEAISEETGGPLYECPECGSVFSRENSYADNHQCPDDRRFSSKVADEACSVCGKAEVEQIEVLTCAVADCRSDDLFDQDGFLDHLRDEHGYRLDD